MRHSAPLDKVHQQALVVHADLVDGRAPLVGPEHVAPHKNVIGGAGAPASGAEGECAYGDAPCEGWFAPALEIPEPMDSRPFDKGLYHMLLDSREGGEKIVLVGRNVFRPGEWRPPVDEISVDDKRLLVDLIQRG